MTMSQHAHIHTNSPQHTQNENKKLHTHTHREHAKCLGHARLKADVHMLFVKKHTHTHTQTTNYQLSDSHTSNSNYLRLPPAPLAMFLVLLLLLCLACKGSIACKGTPACKGTFACKGTKGIAMPFLLLAALSAIQPAEGRPWIAWWRVRTHRGIMYYVHDSGYWEELEPEYSEALEEAMHVEPEMATYIEGNSQVDFGDEISDFPPTWHIPSQQWLMSRIDPDPRVVYVAQPLDVHVWVPQHYPRAAYASFDSVDHTPNWSTGWATVTNTHPAGAAPAYARDGNQHTMVSSDGTIHVWRDHSNPTSRWGRGRSKSPTPTYQWESQGWQSQEWQSWDWNTCQQWHQQCQEWQDWGTGGASGSWAGWSAPAPPNPDRMLYRGVGADKRRKERRELARQGKEIPAHLKPMRISLNKALKRQMHELHTKAREMAEETDPEKLKQWEEEQKVWLEMVAREEAEKRASASPQPEDGSTENQPAEGSQNLPDDGKADDDKAPADVVIGNRPRSRSQSAESRGMRRFYSGRSNPTLVARGLTIPEGEQPEQGSKKSEKKRKKSKKPEKAPLERVKEEKDPDGPSGPGPDGGAAAAAVA